MKKNSALPIPYIHSDVYSTMTGFTRFLHENERLGWRYDKTENMPDSDYHIYTHLLSDRNNYTGFTQYKEPFKQFSRLDLKGFISNPFRNPLIIKEEKVYILERTDIARIRDNSTIPIPDKV